MCLPTEGISLSGQVIWLHCYTPNQVNIKLEEREWLDYDTVKKALFNHFQVTQMTYTTNLDHLKRQSGET